MFCKCPDCHRDVDCSSAAKNVACPYCGRQFSLKGRSTRRVEEVIQVLKHGHYVPPADGLGSPPH